MIIKWPVWMMIVNFSGALSVSFRWYYFSRRLTKRLSVCELSISSSASPSYMSSLTWRLLLWLFVLLVHYRCWLTLHIEVVDSTFFKHEPPRFSFFILDIPTPTSFLSLLTPQKFEIPLRWFCFFVYFSISLQRKVLKSLV